jgi:hypothetical protein
MKAAVPERGRGFIISGNIGDSPPSLDERCEMDDDLKAYLAAMEARLVTHVSVECEKIETKLLTEFHKWGRTSEMRTRQAMTDVGFLGERLIAAEERISALERGDTGGRRTS